MPLIRGRESGNAEADGRRQTARPYTRIAGRGPQPPEEHELASRPGLRRVPAPLSVAEAQQGSPSPISGRTPDRTRQMQGGPAHNQLERKDMTKRERSGARHRATQLTGETQLQPMR